MQFTSKLYSLTAMTNMHVGSGKNNYGIIDNLIQRDVVSGYPTINPSSLKGAMREFFNYDMSNAALVRYIFGSDPNHDNNTNSPGEYRFFPANLLSMPVRSNLLPYLNITCPQVIKTFLDNLDKFGISYPHAATLNDWLATDTGEATHYQANLDHELSIEIMDFKAKKGSFEQMDVIIELFGEYPVLVSDERFKELTNDNHLPAISRNYLENGVSKNLWYEQVLPRQSRFYFILFAPNQSNNHFSPFDSAIQAQPVQIGGNASIGYGFSKISEI